VKARRPLPTTETLRGLFSYDPGAGVVRWRIATRGRGGHIPAGAIAGTKTEGYGKVTINQTTYPTHRVIWKIWYGTEPPDYIDHIDGNKANNKISNLRAATCAQNMANRTSSALNTTGYKGVSKNAGAYVAWITVNYRQRYLGRYRTAAEAHDAYAAAALALHGEFANAGGAP